MTSNEFHYIVVGGGSAGCALAHRLSAESQVRVLLIEAGPDTPPGEEPEEILDGFPLIAYFSRKAQWQDMKVYFRQPELDNRRRIQPVYYEQARIMGGGSSINGQFANRGAPADYDDWARFGIEGWGWENVLPYFRKLETDLDCAGPLHGDRGPIKISRVLPDRWQAFTRASAEVFRRNGFVFLDDQNGEWQDGYFAATISNDREHRVSSARGYLDRATRRRRNLTIVNDTEVEELVTEPGSPPRVVGVIVQSPGGKAEFRAKEVILSAGALHSPCLLMRTGIGPGNRLQALGIDVLADRAGVGANLQEHPSICVSAFLRRPARHDFRLRRHIQMALRASSGIEETDADGDLFICPLSRSGWHGVGARLATYIAILNKPYSRGELRLTDPRPGIEPEVRFNLLSDRRDLERLCYAVRLMNGFFGQEPVTEITEGAFLTAYSETVRKFSSYRQRNRIVMAIAGALLDGPRPLRRWMIDSAIAEAEPIELLVGDDRCLERTVASTAVGVWHASGTCRLGIETDPEAVADKEGRVIGVSGLRVADASIIPVLMRGNTNLPSIMIGEKIADSILSSRQAGPSGGRPFARSFEPAAETGKFDNVSGRPALRDTGLEGRQ